MKYFVTICLLVFVTFGCASASKMNELRVGMTEQDAMKIMGKPDTVSANEGATFLNYILGDKTNGLRKRSYFVKIMDGKVSSFGRRGDFDKRTTLQIDSEDDNN